MMKKVYFLAFLGLFFVSILRGQEYELLTPKLILKGNLLSVFDPFCPAIGGGIEYRISDRKSFEHEVGYIYASPNKIAEGLTGARLRTAFRYYSKDDIGKATFIGFQGTYQILAGELSSFVSRENKKYQQFLQYGNDFRTIDLNVIVGRTFYLGNSERFYIDTYFGFGSSWTTFRYKNLPSDAAIPSLPAWFADSEPLRSPTEIYTQRRGSLFWSLKLAYVLR